MNIQPQAVECQQYISVFNDTTTSCIMSGMNLADRIKLAMRHRNVTQQELAEAGKVAQQTLSKHLSKGDFTSKALPDFAKKLNVDIVWLQLGKEPFPDFLNTLPLNHLAIIKWDDLLNVEHITITEKSPSLLKTQNATDNCYVLEVSNTAMCSISMSLQPGTKIIINPDIKPKSNDYVIASEKSATPVLRQYVVDGARIQLNALNPQYQNIIVDENVKILGVVIARVDLFE